MGGVQSADQGRFGFHVLKVKENSPAFHAGIDQFFDYIISINGTPVDNGDSQALQRILLESEDKPTQLEIYSSKTQSKREVRLTPSKAWHASNPEETSLIGCSIRYCTYERAGEHVWHVLEVSPNSPAEMAGILPHSDYIIGSPHQVLRSEDDFYNLVEDYLGKPLRLYVYNTEWDSCREAIIVPNHDWGGEGSLGCDVGYGLLHRIPSKQKPKESQQQSESGADSQPVYSNTIFNTPEFDSPAPEEQLQGQQEQEQQKPSEEPLQPQPQSPSSSAPQQRAALPDQEALLHEAQNTKLPESPTPATHHS